MLDAIGHIALVVSDPARTAALFESLFNARIVRRVDTDGHHETYVRLGRTWFVLVGANVERSRTGDHIAFQVTQEVLESVTDRLRAMGLEFIIARSNTSLYFFDYDNHVFELDAGNLEAELENPQLPGA
jgi:catechol 2,3-dioxygenase-like lactoylglutathione lyase family enzyme